jgi:hypothetical protein
VILHLRKRFFLDACSSTFIIIFSTLFSVRGCDVALICIWVAITAFLIGAYLGLSLGAVFYNNYPKDCVSKYESYSHVTNLAPTIFLRV